MTNPPAALELSGVTRVHRRPGTEVRALDGADNRRVLAVLRWLQDRG